jgi:DGQHR domain-containing protein
MEEVQTGQISRRAKEFKGHVLGFLKRLNFNDIDGGENFLIGNSQVDACGGHEDTLLIVKCRSAGKKIKRSIREDIRSIKGSIPAYSSALRRMPVYQDYSHRKCIIAIKNIEIPGSDRSFAEDNPEVYIWDEQLIEYYEDLHKIIGDYAKFGLLSEMDVKPRVESRISAPAFKATFGKYAIYSFIVEPQKLLRVAYVARRNIGKENYYQRIIKRDRINKIGDFLSKGGVFPSGIIVSFTQKPKFSPLKKDWLDWPAWLEMGVITFPEEYRSCWIIDGQHRLYASSRVTNPPKIAVTAFENLTFEKQARFFVEINQEQQKVDSDLLWDLKESMIPNSPESRISQVVKRLSQLDPFKERVYVPLRGKKKRGQLTFAGLCSSLKQSKLDQKVTLLLRGKPTSEKIVETIANALSEYFSMVDALFSEEQKNIVLFKNTSLDVFIAVYGKILSRLDRIPTSEDLQNYVGAFQKKMLETYPSSKELRELLDRCASRGGRTEVIKEFEKLIFGEKDTPKDEQELTIFERELAKFIIVKLTVTSWEGFRQVVSQDLYGKALARRANTMDEALTLGECIEIIMGNWPSFQGIFLSGIAPFENRRKFQAALTEVSQYRNKVKHGRSGIAYNEPEVCRLHMEQMRRCMQS